jgi:FKBP-type peptidyl-prolyl cis-trans isomerase
METSPVSIMSRLWIIISVGVMFETASKMAMAQGSAFVPPRRLSVECQTSSSAVALPYRRMQSTHLHREASKATGSMLLFGERGESQMAEGGDKNQQNMKTNLSRRQTFSFFLASSMGGIATPAMAAVLDETEMYANTAPDSAYAELFSRSDGSGSGVNQSVLPKIESPSSKQSEAVASDEINIQLTQQDFDKAQNGLGLELGEIAFRTNSRIFIKSIRPNSLASFLPSDKIQPGFILVGVNGKSTERTNAKGAQMMFAQALKDLKEGKASNLRMTLRDPDVFEASLNALGNDTTSVTTQVAPAGETTQRNQNGSIKMFEKQTFQEAQKVTVTQLTPPKFATTSSSEVGGAKLDDLLEISYIGRVLETDQVFDGSTVSINGKGIPGRGGDLSLFFVLGKQPFGQFPPGWDVGLKGMGIGERRRLVIPPVL